MLRRSVQILGHLGRKVNGLPTSREAKPALNRVTDLLGLVQSQTAPAKWIMPEPLLMKRSRHRVMMKCRGMRKKKNVAGNGSGSYRCVRCHKSFARGTLEGWLTVRGSSSKASNSGGPSISEPFGGSPKKLLCMCQEQGSMRLGLSSLWPLPSPRN